MARNRVQIILSRYDEHKQRKTHWLDMYQLLGDYVMTRKQQFQTTRSPGDFLNRELFDSTAQHSNGTMASSLLGSLWPNGARTFRLMQPAAVEESQEIKDYFERVTQEMIDVMDNPRSGLTIALGEYMADQGVFGTSAVAAFESDDFDVPIRYKAWDVKTMVIAENQDGIVDTIFNEREVTVRQLVLEFGIENVGRASREAFMNGKHDDKVKVLHVIEPRSEIDPFKFGAANMPFASMHIELGVNKILRESGFEEMPVFVTRFIKAMGEIYGRSPAMAALPTIIELNTLWEAVTVAAEKQLDPPLAVVDDGKLGGQIIDTSAGAINVFNVTGRMEATNPVTPLFTVGEFRSIEGLITKLTENITKFFFLDRLLDLNNETRMTAFETQIRNKLRGESLGTLYSRQEAELFVPLIERTFNILLRAGKLGVVQGSEGERVVLAAGVDPFYIPESIARKMQQGNEAYRIGFVSPAQRIKQAEEVQGILTTFDFVNGNASIAPTMVDNIDVDRSLRLISQISGAPSEMLKDLESVKQLRELANARAEQQQQLDSAQQIAESSRAAGQAMQAQQLANK